MDNIIYRINKSQIYPVYLTFFILLIVPVVIIAGAFLGKSMFHLISAAGLWLVILINRKRYLHRPIEIEISNKNVIFRDVFRKEHTLSFTEIISIEVTGPEKLTVKTSSGRITGITAFTGFEEFISIIKSNNNSLNTTGC